MEILEILKNSSENICMEDLAFFEQELLVGGYPSKYVKQCKEQILILKNWLNSAKIQDSSKEEKEEVVTEIKKPIIMSAYDLIPDVEKPTKSAKEIIFGDIAALRLNPKYIIDLKKYVAHTSAVDVAFIDENFSFFMKPELDAFLSVIQFGDGFLEKFFEVLDKDEIAKHQCFSEAFFIKHFSQLDTKIVLTEGKNEWREKEKRSKQLDVFLRLKGVKI